ncbi:MAG: DUF86 domain-containing protein [Paludibacteraceae bacterium]|nr:DUF86 domain-containing protein [Paludibacteraceae bacterium]
MREHNRDKERLEHILDAIRIIENGLTTYSKDELLNTPLLYYGMVKQVEIIGEAANMLTIEFRESHTDVDWRPIVSMRNVLVHDYIHISKDMLWYTLNNDIHDLKGHITHYYKDFE